VPKVQYVGTSNFREITTSDWKNVDVEDQSSTVWDRDNLRTRKDAKKVLEISDAALAYLMENEKGDFKVIQESPPAVTEDATAGTGKPKPPKS
jgi:hypothetical protein